MFEAIVSVPVFVSRFKKKSKNPALLVPIHTTGPCLVTFSWHLARKMCSKCRLLYAYTAGFKVMLIICHLVISDLFVASGS